MSKITEHGEGLSFYEKYLKEDEFFSKNFLLSYSSLNLLLYSPILFYNKYIIRQDTPQLEQYLSEGKAIHCLLLTPERFEKEFIVTPTKPPVEKLRQVLSLLYETRKVDISSGKKPRESLSEYKKEISDGLKSVDLYQTMKDETQRINKVLDNASAISWWEYLKNNENKNIITQETYDFAKTVVEKIQSNTNIMMFMGHYRDPLDNIVVSNELHMLFNELEDYPFGIQGFVDNLVIDHTKKIIKINDLKTTSKSIVEFNSSIEYYKYKLQAAMYKKLVDKLIKQMNLEGYTIEFRFIVIDNLQQIGAFRISEETMSVWMKDLDEALNIAKHHFENRDFNLPYMFSGKSEIIL